MGGNVQGRRVDDLDDLKNPGDFCWMRAAGVVVGMAFKCPSGDGSRPMIRFTGHQIRSQPTWDWDGNEDAPTLSPSLHRTETIKGVERTIWHGFLRKGVFESS